MTVGDCWCRLSFVVVGCRLSCVGCRVSVVYFRLNFDCRCPATVYLSDFYYFIFFEKFKKLRFDRGIHINGLHEIIKNPITRLQMLVN